MVGVVLATLVMCRVDDPAAALTEVRRVLVPGGELRFMEHVRALTGGWGRFQDWATPVWKRIGGGCHPNRDTAATLKQVGLEVVEMQSFSFGPYPVRPHIVGVARCVN